MDLAGTLLGVPAREWETEQAIVFDWHDGPVEGICALAKPGGEFLFKLVDERHNPDGLDSRLFAVRQVPLDSVNRILNLLTELGEPENALWVPVWQFEKAESQQAAERFLQELDARAQPVPVVFSSPDLKCFQGCWSAEDFNGEALSWSAIPGASLAPQE